MTSSPPTPAAEFAQVLARGVQALNLSLSDEQQADLLAFIFLIQKWNRVYNLTAVTDPREMVVRHLLDSLAMAPHVHGPRVLDVGTGAGLPGIPLAIARPDLEFVLLDRTAKKTRFVTQAVGELRLTNVRVETRRVEQYHPLELFDTVISRAFSSLAEFALTAGTLLAPHGLLLAMKGRYPTEELAALPAGYRAEKTTRLDVPGLDEERHAVYLRHQK